MRLQCARPKTRQAHKYCFDTVSSSYAEVRFPLLQGRNRRCITVDMRQEGGRRLIQQLASKVDVLVENFRPGVMEKWNLGPKVA